MDTRVSDNRQHQEKWKECFKAAAVLARSQADACLGSGDNGMGAADGKAWAEIAAYFESKLKGGRGFSSMSPLRQIEVAAAGGIKAHQYHRAHVFTSQQAQAAGAIGGARVSSDRVYMAEIGRRGGRARAAGLLANRKGDSLIDAGAESPTHMDEAARLENDSPTWESKAPASCVAALEAAPPCSPR